MFGGLLASGGYVWPSAREEIREIMEILEDFLEEAAWGKGYRASITDNLQHDGDGGARVQHPQHHCFTCVPDQPLPALLCYTWGNQGWEEVRLFSSSTYLTQASGKGLQSQPGLGQYPPWMAQYSQWAGGRAWLSLTSPLPLPASSKGAAWGRKIPEFPGPMLLPKLNPVGPVPRSEGDRRQRA